MLRIARGFISRPIRRATIGVRVAIATATVLAAFQAQALSIYVDYYSGSTFGNGAPSNSFGAAAGIPGTWNELSFLEVNTPVVDTLGNATGVTVSNNEGGTSGNNGAPLPGDVSLLLNDALDSGSNVTITVAGLPTGMYDVYTYSWYPANATTVLSTLTVNGLNPQNVGRTTTYGGFSLGETHALHTVSITSPQTLTIDAAVANLVAIVNGFQIVQVPEPASLVLALVGAVGAIAFRRRSRT